MLSAHLISVLHSPNLPRDEIELTRHIEAYFGAQAGPGLVAEAIVLAEAAIIKLAEVQGRSFDEVLAELDG